MTDYERTYLLGMYYDINAAFDDQFIPCEICDKRACDIHHIDARGMGGTTQVYTVKDLMAVCRECHNEYGDKKQYMQLLVIIHRLRVMMRKIWKITSILYPS